MFRTITLKVIKCFNPKLISYSNLLFIIKLFLIQGPLKESTTMTTPATRRKQTETTARTRSTQLGTQASSQANTQTYGRTSDATTEPSLMFTEVVKSEESMTTKNNGFSVATKVPSTQRKTNTKGSDLQPPSTQRLIEISTKGRRIGLK